MLADSSSIKQLAERNTIEFTIAKDGEKFDKAVYEEVQRTPALISARGFVHLARLKGISKDQVRSLGSVPGKDENDDITNVLRVAQAIIEAKAAEICLCDDVYTSDQVAKLFEGSLSRVSAGADPSLHFAKLKEIAGLPDVGALALQEKNILKDLFALRNSANGAQFRKWFHANCKNDPANTAREYNSLLRSIPFIELATKCSLRFFAQLGVAVGMVPFDPLAGLAAGATASAIDTYLVGRILKGASPKIFLEKLNDLSSAASG